MVANLKIELLGCSSESKYSPLRSMVGPVAGKTSQKIEQDRKKTFAPRTLEIGPHQESRMNMAHR